MLQPAAVLKTEEFNFDGIAGPTHNHSGLAYGNFASLKNRFALANPRAAALQGLEKIKLLCRLGVKQGLIPPQERPFIPGLRALGYTGTDGQVLQKASQKDRLVFLKHCSSSSMWTANAATVSPSLDAQDKRFHITPANLISQQHRVMEVSFTTLVLQKIFPKAKFFTHHPPFANDAVLCDEGAANHMRLCPEHGKPGIEIFVHGKSTRQLNVPRRYPARQSKETSYALARAHCLDVKQSMFVQQNPEAVDLGVFHNDVIALSNEHVLIFHERAFAGKNKFMTELQQKFGQVSCKPPYLVEVKENQLGIQKAVETYFFNSQLVTVPSGGMALIAPQQCREDKKTSLLINDLIAWRGSPLKSVYFVDLNESMRNGGGPACLRLRVVLTLKEQSSVHSGFLVDEQRIAALEKWVTAHYRDRLHIDELADPRLLKESYAALDELTKIMRIGSIYSFQKN